METIKYEGKIKSTSTTEINEEDSDTSIGKVNFLKVEEGKQDIKISIVGPPEIAEFFEPGEPVSIEIKKLQSKLK